MKVGSGTRFPLEFSAQFYMVFSVFHSTLTQLNCAHSSMVCNIFFPCESSVSQLPLTVKSDYITGGTRDVDRQRWLQAVQVQIS